MAWPSRLGAHRLSSRPDLRHGGGSATGDVGGHHAPAQKITRDMSAEADGVCAARSPNTPPAGDQHSRPLSSRWGWARLLKRVFAIDMERCPRCHQGALRMIAAITCRPVIRRLLGPLQLAADPPPLAPARLAPGRFAWTSV
jgi:hypothetical protein